MKAAAVDSNQQTAETTGDRRPMTDDEGEKLGREKSEDALAKVNKSSGTDDQPPSVMVYDATKQQRIPFMIEHTGESYEVAFVLDAQTDAALITYEKLLDRRFFAADQRETGERNAVESTDKGFDASVWLFNDRAVTAEGFAEEGELPDDWKDSIADDDKAAVIDEAYLAAAVVPLPIAKPGKRLPLSYRKESPVSTVNLKALYEGHELVLSHVLKPPTADQVARFKSIQKERLIVQGTHLGKGETRIPPKARKLGSLYDELKESATGYANDQVPLHHKMIVVTEHLQSEVEAVRKN
jgi:hypothetical protein